MNIVVTNECFLSNSQVDRLGVYGKVEIFNDTTTEGQAIERLKDADIAIVDSFLCPTNFNILSSASKLKYITLNSTGFDAFDLDSAKEKNIIVSNLPGYSTEAVAEQAIALMFSVLRNIVSLNNKFKANPYEIDPNDKSQLPYLGFNIKGKTLGVVGLGAIGQRVAEMGIGLGMKVIAYNRTSKNVPGVSLVQLDELLKQSDVVTLHLPLNNQSMNLISEPQLNLMKPNAILINTARGKIVNTSDLFNALKNNKIKGAGLDVLAEYDKSNPLLALENVVITPHSAWYTKETFDALGEMVVSNVEAFIKGNPVNVIS